MAAITTSYLLYPFCTVCQEAYELRARGFGSQFGPQGMMMGGMGMMGPGMMGGKAFAARTMKSKSTLVQPLLLFARFATRSRLETDTLLLSFLTGARTANAMQCRYDEPTGPNGHEHGRHGRWHASSGHAGRHEPNRATRHVPTEHGRKRPVLEAMRSTSFGGNWGIETNVRQTE